MMPKGYHMYAVSAGVQGRINQPHNTILLLFYILYISDIGCYYYV